MYVAMSVAWTLLEVLHGKQSMHTITFLDLKNSKF